MNREAIKSLLNDVTNGELTTHDATERLVSLPYEELSHSTLDLHRELRQGSPEVIFGENKTSSQIADNLQRINHAHGKAFATRVTTKKAAEIQQQVPNSQYHSSAQAITLNLPEKTEVQSPYVTVLTAGTSDIPVADEAALTLRYLEHSFLQITDVGVAGLHRLLPHLETLRTSSVIIAIAGMEGALPSVIGGLVSCPVVAVPTSVGYGTARHGETALHAMLTSCASGISVMNIDNGFGAAIFADTILRQIHKVNQ